MSGLLGCYMFAQYQPSHRRWDNTVAIRCFAAAAADTPAATLTAWRQPMAGVVNHCHSTAFVPTTAYHCFAAAGKTFASTAAVDAVDAAAAASGAAGTAAAAAVGQLLCT